MLDDVSKAIHQASGILKAAGRLDMRANKFSMGTAPCGLS